MKKKKEKNGTCYPDHFKWLMKNGDNLPDARLVHGTGWSISWNKRITHCWIELGGGDVVIDLTVNYIGRASEYYAKADVKVDRRYTKAEACKMVLKTKHYGHWEEEEEEEYDNEK